MSDTNPETGKKIRAIPKYKFKVILIGGIAVGKTSILKKYTEDECTLKHRPTIGVEYKVKSFIVQNTTRIEMKIWDTSGDERYKSMTRQYYRESHAIILVYDITNKNSFNTLNDWLVSIQENAPKDAIIVMVGNKNDLNDQRQVTYGDGKRFADSNNIFYFCETSAVTGENVPVIFEKVGDKLVQNIKDKNARETEGQLIQGGLKGVGLDGQKFEKKNKKCC